MQKTFEKRLADLEKLERGRRGDCQGWVVLDEAGEVVRGCTCDRDDHKVYGCVSPDDWDDNEP